MYCLEFIAFVSYVILGLLFFLYLLLRYYFDHNFLCMIYLYIHNYLFLHVYLRIYVYKVFFA